MKIKKLLGLAVSLVVVVGIFAYAVPKFADYHDVWSSVKTLTPIEFWTLFAAMVFNLFTYWFANMAAVPGLRLLPSAVLTQTTTSVANTLPGGGAIAVGLTYSILNSWGFSGTTVALYVGVTGIWNIFAKLSLPVLSIVFLVVAGKSSAAYASAAVIGVAVLAGAVSLFAAVLWSAALARRVGERLQRIVSPLLRLFRRGARPAWGDGAVKFRRDTIGLVEHNWFNLTWTTLLSHLALFFVLVLSLRHMGVSERELSTVQVFAVFAFSRLLSAIPITPGGVGVIDLGYIGGLTAAAPSSEKVAVVAAVLLFRVLTYGVQIPLGGLTYMIWRVKKSWLKAAPAEPSSVEQGRLIADSP